MYFLLNWSSVTVTLFGFTLYLFYKYLTRHHNYWKTRGVPYEEPYFLFGSFWEVLSGKKHFGKHLGHLHSKYTTPYFGIYILGKPFLVIRSPEIIKNVFIRDFKNFPNRSFACDKNADKLAANSLTTMKNPKWRYIRTKLAPIFTPGKLKLMVNIFKQSATGMEDYLTQFDNEVVDVMDIFSKYFINVIASSFFGYDANAFKNNNSEFLKLADNLFSSKLAFLRIFAHFFVPTLVSLLKIQICEYGGFKKILLDNLNYRRQHKVKRDDLLDFMLQLEESNKDKDGDMEFGPDQMVANSMTLFFAGSDTTISTVAFALYELCLQTDYQDKLREEIFEHIKTDEDITYTNIKKMEYLDMVVSETLRKYPVGSFLNRNCEEDYLVEETGLVIEKDTPIFISPDGLHSDPEYFPNPERFDPDRFVDENKQKYMRDCVYIPFGVGPRNCVGDRFALISAKIGLICFLRKYKVERCQETEVPIKLNSRRPVLMPLNGILMRMKKL